MKSVALLGSLRYKPAVQKVDLENNAVFDTCPELVEELKEAKNKLTELISEGAVPS